MFNSVALDVVIGLIFIFLLYSLLATVLSEMIATVLGLRARNLKAAISRMLNDDKARSLLGRFWNSVRILKVPDNQVINSFYSNPEINCKDFSMVYTLTIQLTRLKLLYLLTFVKIFILQ